MLYEVRVFNKDMVLQKVISAEKVMMNHWGADRKCKGCGIIFKAKLKGGVWKGIKPRPSDPKQFIPNLVPDLGHCSPECKRKNVRKVGRSRNKLGTFLVMRPCDICQTPFYPRNKMHKRHNRVCSKKASALRTRELDRESKAKREAKKLVTTGMKRR